MRIRTLKPEFWSDEKLSGLPPIDRLVFLGLISMADDCGRLLDNLKRIDAFVFPNTDDSAREALARLSRMARIVRGTTSSGQPVIQIANWSRHQKVDHPNLKSALPELVEPQVVTSISEPLANDSRGVREPLALRPTTNDQRPTTVADAGASAEAPSGIPWSKQAVALYQAHVMHPMAPGRITKVLKPFVEKDGAADVLRRWEEFCKVGRHYGLDGKGWREPPLPVSAQTPERFRDTYAEWGKPAMEAA